MRIVFTCRAFDNMAGGVERMACVLMEAMRVRGHDVCLLTWDKSDAGAFYDMHQDIEWYQLGIGDPKIQAGFKQRWKRAQKMRKILRSFKPDLISRRAVELGWFPLLALLAPIFVTRRVLEANISVYLSSFSVWLNKESGKKH